MKYIYYQEDGTIVAVMKRQHQEYSEYKCLETELENVFQDGYQTKIKSEQLVFIKCPEPEPTITTRQEVIEKLIEAKKAELAKTDYQAIKYAEGWYTAEEYEPIKAERQAIRDEINRLEEELTEGE